MKISVIIINYNTFELTCNCIRSIKDFVDNSLYEIILVDNASTECDPDQFLEKFKDIKLIKSSVNLGFAKGNNLGISYAVGDFILLLNSDTYLIEDCFSKLIKLYNQVPNTGITSIKILYPDGKFQHTARKFRSIRNELIDFFRPILYLFPYRKRVALMLNQYFNGDFSLTCDWVSGAFMMFPREILKELQGHKLDERFFMYGEDQLWCYQFQQLGYSIYFFSEASVVHIANASTAPSKYRKLIKTMLKNELEVIAYRRGSKDIYYHVLKMILTLKELGRYYVKVLLNLVFNYKLR